MKINTIIIYYITILISTFIMLKIYEKYSENKLKWTKKNISIFLVMSILCFLNNIFMFNIIKIVIASILSYLLFKIIFNDDWKSTIFYTLIITIILHIIDLSSSLLLPLWIKNVEMLNHSILFKVVFSVSVNILLYVITANKFTVNFFKKLKGTSKNNKLFYTLGIIGLLTINFWLFYIAGNTADKGLNIIICFTEIILMFLLLNNLHNKYEQNLLQIKEEQLKQNLDLYSKVALEYKELKHNLMNDLLIIKTKVKKNNQEFINEIINKYKSNYEWVNCITDIPEGLQGLVFLKKNQAELKNINFNLEYNVSKNVENLFSINKNFKLYESLGILFDNAIEGAAESTEKVINVVFSYDQKTLKIDILNTFNNEIDLDKIGNKNYSTKKRGSGIGLNYLKKQNKKFKINQHIRDNIFITEVIINPKEKK